jgi:small-conductance mechanosensitive channel
VEAQQQLRFDRSHFMSYGDSALNFETVYFVLSADYLVYANINQAVNLAVLRRFATEKIEFAYPTRTILLRREPSASATA